MDTSGFSQVGKYGTISLMKRQDPNTAVTAFGIDTDEVTFGRDPNCSVRLYYPDVSLVHCRIVFEDRKAFLVVLGTGGLAVDGCHIYPTSDNGTPLTIPLSNNSNFEIRGKRFRFSYPPKEIRATLLATPARADRRAPRLSMIQSAQVFSPKPSNDPRENLRILKSPLKNTFKSPIKREFSTPSRSRIFAPPSSPLKSLAHVQEEQEGEEDEDDDEEDDIILVEGNHPRVVEEEADLVILEDVVPAPPVPTPLSRRSRSRSRTPVPAAALQQQQPHHQQQQVQQQHQQQPQPQPPTTPHRRASSLHRAVLIRSAQRAVIRAETEERERQEEEEEMEVLESVASMVVDDSDGEGEGEEDMDLTGVDVLAPVALFPAALSGAPAPAPAAVGDEEDEDAGSGEEGEGEEEEEEEDATPVQKLNWRKSLEKLWPFRSSSPGNEDGANRTTRDSDTESEDDEDPKKEGQDQDQGAEGEHEEDGDEDEEKHEFPAPLRSTRFPTQTPIRRHLGSFMTPQVKPRTTVLSSSYASRGSNLFSRLGVDETRRSGDGESQGRRSLEPLRQTPRAPPEPVRIPKTEQVWRVRDLLRAPGSAEAGVPPPQAQAQGQKPGFGNLASAGDGVGTHAVTPPLRSTRRVVDEAERQAIRERRRSALRELDSPFGGAVPGMGPGGMGVVRSPMKAMGSSSSSASGSLAGSSSAAAASTSAGYSASPAKSPSKLFRLADLPMQREEPEPVSEQDVEKETEKDEQVDTRRLLDKMMETVEGMKRRRSMAGNTPIRAGVSTLEGRAMLPRMSLGFEARRTPTMSPRKSFAASNGLLLARQDDEDEEEEDKENQGAMMDMDMDGNARPLGVVKSTPRQAVERAPRFSLLRGSVLADIRPQVEDEESEGEGDGMDVDEPVPEPVRMNEEQSEDEVPPASTSIDVASDPEAEAEVQDEEEEEGVAPRVPTPPLTKAPTRRIRQRTAEPVEEPQANEASNALEPEPAPAPTRRSRRTSTVEPEEHPAPVAPRRGRSRSATVEPEEVPTTVATGVGAAPARRGRKPVERIEEAEEGAGAPKEEADPQAEEKVPPKAKAGHRKRAGSAAKKMGPAPHEEEEEEEETVEAAPPVTKRGRTPKSIATPTAAATAKRGAKAKATVPPADELEGAEEDPLDTIDEDVIEAKPARGKKKVAKDEPVHPKAPAANPTATRIARIKSNSSLKTAAAAAATGAGASRTTKAGTTATAKTVRITTTSRSAAITTTAAKTPAARARGTTKKTPATAPAASQTQGDKENAPGSDGSSGAGEEPVKVRVSKTTRKAVSGTAIPTRTRSVKKEVVDDEPAAPPADAKGRGKIMRSSRTRTKP